MTAKENTEKIRPIVIGDKRRGTGKCTAEETTCLRSVVGSIGMGGQASLTRGRIPSVEISKAAGSGFIKDMRKSNKVVEYAQVDASVGIHFTS